LTSRQVAHKANGRIAANIGCPDAGVAAPGRTSGIGAAKTMANKSQKCEKVPPRRARKNHLCARFRIFSEFQRLLLFPFGLRDRENWTFNVVSAQAQIAAVSSPA
jgi:hypothetical protein